jgi:hypothetical protein
MTVVPPKNEEDDWERFSVWSAFVKRFAGTSATIIASLYGVGLLIVNMDLAGC